MSPLGKILFAGKDQKVAALVADSLVGYHTEQAASFAKLEEKLESFQPDVVIVSEDLLDEGALARAEKMHSKYPRAEIILISPAAPQLGQNQVLETGFSHWLRFPFDVEFIQFAVADCMRRAVVVNSEAGDRIILRDEMDFVLSEISDGVILIDEERKMALANRTACNALRLNIAELVGKPYDEALSHRTLLSAIRGDSPDPNRVEILGEDESYYRVTSVQIKGLGQLVTLHDITYLKELNRMKTQFVNTVSHDIRSPLTSILGYVELVKRVGEVNRQQEEFITQVQDSVHRITQLISEVLDLGRIESRLDKNFAKVSLYEIAREVLVNLRPVIAKADLTLAMEMEDRLPDILGDSIQLRQLVENLVGNAIKYTPAGGTITIRGRSETDQIIFQVEDTGVGIPLDDQSKIFEPFYRANNVSEETEGSGLGLAITKTVVDNHRGRIWVDSKLGMGAMFTVVLPVYGR
ncbi:MAG: hypothetical protein JW757_08690 [Anaerolineales bacterium]|nr:hypothetical protein [Anaerolineales bacterium]